MSPLLRLKPKFVHMCPVYVAFDDGRALLASTFNHGGLFVEKPGGVRAVDTGDGITLGEAIIACMADCSFKPRFNYSSRKKSDWPAYQASGCRSMKAFERDFARYTVRSANDANIIWTLKSPELSGGFTIQSTVGMIHDALEVGAAITNLHAFYMKVRDLS